LNSIIEFQAEERIKYIFVEAKTLDDRERHPALEMLTSRTAHADRERERERERRYLQNNIKAKPDQLKLSKTGPLTWP
jgi:hypothetical protein